MCHHSCPSSRSGGIAGVRRSAETRLRFALVRWLEWVGVGWSWLEWYHFPARRASHFESRPMAFMMLSARPTLRVVTRRCTSRRQRVTSELAANRRNNIPRPEASPHRQPEMAALLVSDEAF